MSTVFPRVSARVRLFPFVLLLAVLGAACAPGGGEPFSPQAPGSTPAANPPYTATGTAAARINPAVGFLLTDISVPEGAIWEINRAMEFTFNEDVDFATVSLNTINIQSTAGQPASGTFTFQGIDTDGDGTIDEVDPRIVVFQPTCPTLPDLSDAGLQAGSVAYVITVPGLSSGAMNTVQSQAGEKLRNAGSRNFTTPDPDDPGVFYDPVVGPPVPVIRAVTSLATAASHLEIGGDETQRVYFEFDAGTQTYSLDDVDDLDGDGSTLTFDAPLNLYADETTRVAVLLYFNQPVNPAEGNISSNLLQVEYRDAALAWHRLDTRVELVANCIPTGALVRLEPVGILPIASEFRTVVRPGFQDLVGETNLLAIDEFGQVPTSDVVFTSLTPPGDLSDEVMEEFSSGADDPRSFEDGEYLSALPKAHWGDGELRSVFDFDGVGGPGGDFDWYIRSGEVFIFDTTATDVIGGPGGLPLYTQNCVDGFVDLRDLVIEEGGTLRVIGPNVMTITATGSVQIRGLFDANGFPARDVATLNTGNIPELGGVGAAGGGTGGTGSWVTDNSTPYGGPGWGAFQLTAGGGVGGESGYEGSSNKHNRRPGGGGGGRLGPQQVHWGETALLLYAHDGNHGHSQSTGAVSNLSPAAGGGAGSGPFADGNDTNDFWGIHADAEADPTFVRGEAQGMLAGGGGGGGGDALPSDHFPSDNWGPGSDEKGGGGGGGGGGIHVRALGPITFGASGVLQCDGGLGATGENVLYLDHIGGSGGSGSGGHIVLETASYVDFTDAGVNLGMGYNEFLSAQGGPQVIGNTGWLGDEPTASRGGEGGPGVIQLHVPDPLAPVGTVIDGSHSIFVPITAAFENEPLHYVSKPGALPMVPFFAARSEARSKWISLGGADQDPGGGEDLVEFLFRGTDASDGGVLTSGDGTVDRLPFLLAGNVSGSSTVAVLPDGVTLRLTGASLDPLRDPTPFSSDLYLRTPALLEGFLLRLWEAGNHQDFDVVAATYDDAGIALELTVDDGGGSLQGFLDQAVQPVAYRLYPRFFRVATGGVPDALAESTGVRIFFHATIADIFGDPDEDFWTTIGDQTAGNEGNVYDIADLNDLPPGQLQFFRFVVVFELGELGPDTENVALDFLRVPFRF